MHHTFSPAVLRASVTDDAITSVFGDSYLSFFFFSLIFLPLKLLLLTAAQQPPRQKIPVSSPRQIPVLHYTYSICIYRFNLLLRSVFESLLPPRPRPASSIAAMNDSQHRRKTPCRRQRRRWGVFSVLVFFMSITCIRQTLTGAGLREEIKSTHAHTAAQSYVILPCCTHVLLEIFNCVSRAGTLTCT